MPSVKEHALETMVLDWLAELDWEVVHGPDIAPGGDQEERTSYDQVLLLDRLGDSLRRINPDIPESALNEAIDRISSFRSPELISGNRDFHYALLEGISVEVPADDGFGGTLSKSVSLIDFDDVYNNDFLAVNQFTVTENKRERRADVLLFVNGIPLVVMELKSPTDESVSIKTAWNQLNDYKQDLPTLFTYNALEVVSDGFNARVGTITAGLDRFQPWRSIDGQTISKNKIELETLLFGLFSKERFLDFLRNFIIFEDDGQTIVKKTAAYHQYWAVNKAVDCTVRASRPKGDKRIGVVWHTQGSGKSLSMVFFTGKIVRHDPLENPTVLVITDRNDLDDQLHTTFAHCHRLFQQSPKQAGNRDHLRELLNVPSGGIVFTTIQKFVPDNKGAKYPMLSDRRNIIVIADEAHRSQYAFKNGFARHIRDALPNASFIGFTGTPLETGDRNTPAVFGNYIDTYDVLRAVEDGATVRIYYESRLALLKLRDSERPKIDKNFEEVMEGEEEEVKQKVRSKWAALEAMVGAESRIDQVAADLVAHLEKRFDAMEGKAMIVCMSRRICVAMYEALWKVRPDWHGDEDTQGTMKIVMSGSPSDPPEWKQHIRSKKQREDLASLFKDENSGFKIVIVRDMWLTGFDCPCLHTMYLDKPMHGYGLMQAIARVNRVFKDKPGGLVVDYIGLTDSLKRAMRDYTNGGGKGESINFQDEAADLFLERQQIVRDMLHGFDYAPALDAPDNKRLSMIENAMDHILAIDPHEGRKRYFKAVTALNQAFALAVPHENVLAARDELVLFQDIRARFVKVTTSTKGGGGIIVDEKESAIRQLVSNAVVSKGMIDIFSHAGLNKPDISIFSDEFLEDVRRLPQKNLALEALRKLLDDEIKIRSAKNIVQSRSFAEMLERAIRKYQNRSLETAEVIDELVRIAKELRQSDLRGEKLKLNDDEIAFYDALANNVSAREIMGDKKLVIIAQLLTEQIRKSVSIDWTLRDSARAKIRVMVRRILRQYGYPPDMTKEAVQLVLAQAETLCKEWIND